VEGYEALYLQWLTAEVKLTDPLRPNKRFHDKMWVVDGESPEGGLAIVGGLNIANEYFRVDPAPANRWHDQDILLRGPIVKDVSRAFDRNYAFFKGIKGKRRPWGVRYSGLLPPGLATSPFPFSAPSLEAKAGLGGFLSAPPLALDPPTACFLAATLLAVQAPAPVAGGALGTARGAAGHQVLGRQTESGHGGRVGGAGAAAEQQAGPARGPRKDLVHAGLARAAIAGRAKAGFYSAEPLRPLGLGIVAAEELVRVGAVGHPAGMA